MPRHSIANRALFGHEETTRQILGNVPTWLAASFYVLAATASLWAFWGYFRRFQQHRRGRAPSSSISSTRRSTRLPYDDHEVGRNKTGHDEVAAWRRLIGDLLFARGRLQRDRYAGMAHRLVLYGFLILFVGTCLVFLEHDTPLHFFYGWFYLVASFIVDLGGLAFLWGLGMFAWRRHVVRSDFILQQWWISSLIWLLLAIGVTGFLLEGARIARDMPRFEQWSVVGYQIARGLRGMGFAGDDTLGLHRWLWMFHAVLCVALFALLPWRFFGHALYGMITILQRSDHPLHQLRPMPDATQPGARTWQDLTPRDLLQADACTTCGRCVSVCPAHAAGKPLQPRDIVLAIRAAMDQGEQASPLNWIADDTLWSCTTCGACDHACPVGIEIHPKIVEMRRTRVEGGIVPEGAERVYENVADSQNPYNRSNADRLLWAQGLDVPVVESDDESVELLYWVGCAGSFDPDGQAVTRSMIKILKHLQVKFRVMGCRERCTGDPARRLGEEGLFREQAALNIESLSRHRVLSILTHCPHCLNTLKNEYPLLANVSWTVVHHTEFLAEAISQGRLKPTSVADEKVTFHDPCYLGRGNGVVQAPRLVLQSAMKSPVVEMSRHGKDSFCCGAGGGGVWVDVPGQQRIEHLRAREAAATETTTVATACPFCRLMMRTGMEAVSTKPVRVRDVAEIIAENL